MNCNCGKPIQEKLKDLEKKFANKVELKTRVEKPNSNAFIISNYNKDAQLKCHLDILKYYPEDVKIIVVNMGRTPLSLNNCKVLNLPDSGTQIGPLVALMKGIEVAWEEGITKICHRPAESWVFNHKRVQENFAREAIFQGFNWAKPSLEDFSLTECYLNVERFMNTYEEFANWALFYDRDWSCEIKLARWVNLSLKTPQEIFRFMDVPHPANENLFNEGWQFIGDQKEEVRKENYKKIRNSIPYVDKLEKEHYFQRWLNNGSSSSRLLKII